MCAHCGLTRAVRLSWLLRERLARRSRSVCIPSAKCPSADRPQRCPPLDSVSTTVRSGSSECTTPCTAASRAQAPTSVALSVEARACQKQ